MTPWDLTLNLKDVVLDFTFLSLFLIAGTILRRYIPFFQRFLIPNNIIGGLIGLILGSQVLKIVPLDGNRLGMYVYHLLALTFIILGLRQSKTSFGKGPVSKAFIELACYITQAMAGLLVAFTVIYFFKPDFFAGIGFLVSLGFGMGPGIAYTMGHSWEKAGLADGGMIGLTFAVIGFLIAYIAGITLVNRGIRKGETTLIKGKESLNNDIRTGIVKENSPGIAGFLTLSPEAIEPMAFQVGLIGSIYLLTYLVIRGITLLMDSGGLGEFSDTLWSFHFVIGLLIAVGIRKILDVTKKSYVIDKGLMNRASGVSVDYLVTGSVAAISLTVISHYWLPILFMSSIAAFSTYLIIRWASKRAFDDYHFERFIGIFGEMTGTINSGLVLVRITDPEFESPAAEDLAYGGGIALFLGFPLLIILNLPIVFFNNSIAGYWIAFAAMFVYLLILMAVWRGIGYIKPLSKKP
jgi:ESS family glutamate:Na+ symporter